MPLIIILISASAGFSQLDQGGYISPNDSVFNSFRQERILYLPKDGFSFYEVPNGDFKGKILPGPPLELNNSEPEIDTLLSATVVGTSIRAQMIPLNFFFQTSDERYHLSFEQKENDYVLVFSKTFKGWIPVEEITDKGFELINWMEFYGKSKGRMIHPVEKLAPIRLSPSTDAKIIETADELYSEISSTGKCEGPYCFVQVTQYRNPYDPTKSREENIIKKYKGWLQIVDELGKPLVAHNSNSQ